MSEYFENGMRVIVVGEEPEERLRKTGSAIPIGTTGTIFKAYEDHTENPATDQDEDIHDVVFDIPFDGKPGHFDRGGKVMFSVFSSMIAPLEPEEIEAPDISGLFD